MGMGAPKDMGMGAPKDMGMGAPKDTGMGAPKDTGMGAPKDTGMGAPMSVQVPLNSVTKSFTVYGYDTPSTSPSISHATAATSTVPPGSNTTGI
jgi:hypothetical protein